MVTRHIENLRQKPEEHRRAVAFGVSAAVTGAIMLVWLVTISGRFAGFNNNEPVTATARDAVAPSGLEVSGRQEAFDLFNQVQTEVDGGN